MSWTTTMVITANETNEITKTRKKKKYKNFFLKGNKNKNEG